jgi:hypothetical protein
MTTKREHRKPKEKKNKNKKLYRVVLVSHGGYIIQAIEAFRSQKPADSSLRFAKHVVDQSEQHPVVLRARMTRVAAEAYVRAFKYRAQCADVRVVDMPKGD